MRFQSFLRGCSSFPDPYWLVIVFSLRVEVIFSGAIPWYYGEENKRTKKFVTCGLKLPAPPTTSMETARSGTPTWCTNNVLQGQIHSSDIQIMYCKVRYTHLIYEQCIPLLSSAVSMPVLKNASLVTHLVHSLHTSISAAITGGNVWKLSTFTSPTRKLMWS